jgi:hypothetical protein
MLVAFKYTEDRKCYISVEDIVSVTDSGNDSTDIMLRHGDSTEINLEEPIDVVIKKIEEALR